MGIYTCIYIYNVYIHVYTYYLHDIHVIYVCTCNVHVYILPHITYMYDVATISRLLKCIGLFCKRVLKKRPDSAKETYISHHMHMSHDIHIRMM